MKFIHIFGTFLTLMLLSASIAWGAPIAGHVILSKGEVTAVDESGTARSLKRRSEIFNGDTIKTGAIGSVQIRFIDKALMTIKANSEMSIESYLLAQQGGDAKDEKVLMNLVKGGFRTITGSIGKGDKSAYKVNTPAASIGIRGTNYEIQQESGDSFVFGVYNGGITVENEAGSIDLGFGADFNFSRVTPNTSPKGLLTPPKVLAQNNATNQDNESDETDNNESSGDGDSDGLPEEPDNENENESESQPNTDDSSSNEPEGNNLLELQALLNTDNPVVEKLPVDKKNEDEVEENSGDVVDYITGGEFDKDINDALLSANLISQGQTFEDLDPNLLEIYNQWRANSTNIQQLLALINEYLNEQSALVFDFNTPYNNVDIDASGNPFNATVISDEAYALGESEKIAVIAMPIVAPGSYSGDSPAISTLEAQLMSPEAISFSGFDYTNQNTQMRLSFTVINTSNGQRIDYELEMQFDFDTTSDNITSFSNYVSSVFAENDVFFRDETLGTEGMTSNPGLVSVSFNSTTQKFEFIPTTSSNEFILEMELSFNNDGSAATLALMADMGTPASGGDHWYAESGLDLFIGNGSWDAANNRPLFVLNDKDEYDDGNGNTITDDRIEVVQKPDDTYTILNDDNEEEVIHATVSSLSAFALCIENEQTCDIQVNSVNAASNIRWGAWLAEPGEGIQITEFKVNDNTIETNQEEDILAFWLAAERADINQLTGTANFSASSDCARFSECIGFADDGIVQNLTANFDVNFDTGAITNGNLIVETTKDPDLGLLGGSGAVESTWNVNFSGQMTNANTADARPEFQTNSINGSVVDATNPSNNSTSIVGNIGGIFVKPGDVFAGGYNLGTTDTGKHAAGVFTMDKAP